MNNVHLNCVHYRGVGEGVNPDPRTMCEGGDVPADKGSTTKAHRPLADGLIVLFRVEITGGHLWPRREPLCLLCGWSQHGSQRLSLRHMGNGEYLIVDEQDGVPMRKDKFGVSNDSNQDTVRRQAQILQRLARYR